MALKDEWKGTGKGFGKSFANLGKSIVKTVKVGADAILDEGEKDENGVKKPTGLKESWSEVGRDFGDTGKHLGRAAKGTAGKVVEVVEDHPKEEAAPTENKTEE